MRPEETDRLVRGGAGYGKVINSSEISDCSYGFMASGFGMA